MMTTMTINVLRVQIKTSLQVKGRKELLYYQESKHPSQEFISHVVNIRGGGCDGGLLAEEKADRQTGEAHRPAPVKGPAQPISIKANIDKY